MIHLNVIVTTAQKPAFQQFYHRWAPYALCQKHTKSPRRNASPTTHHPEGAYMH